LSFVKGSSDLIAGFMGTWSSDAKYGYFWAMRKRIAGVASEMAHAAADDATHRHSRA
jgi:NADH:ubiquinone oxidoreductase subunit H